MMIRFMQSCVMFNLKCMTTKRFHIYLYQKIYVMKENIWFRWNNCAHLIVVIRILEHLVHFYLFCNFTPRQAIYWFLGIRCALRIFSKKPMSNLDLNSITQGNFPNKWSRVNFTHFNFELHSSKCTERNVKSREKCICMFTMNAILQS